MTYKPKGGKWPESIILCILRLLVTSHDPLPFLPCNKLHRGTMLYALQTEGGEGVFVNSDSVQFALVEFQKPAKVSHS